MVPNLHSNVTPHWLIPFTVHTQSEDEALALAIAASMNETTPHPSSGSIPGPHTGAAAPPSQAPPTSSQLPPGASHYDDDEALARAIAASLNDEQPRPNQRRPNQNV